MSKEHLLYVSLDFHLPEKSGKRKWFWISNLLDKRETKWQGGGHQVSPLSSLSTSHFLFLENYELLKSNWIWTSNWWEENGRPAHKWHVTQLLPISKYNNQVAAVMNADLGVGSTECTGCIGGLIYWRYTSWVISTFFLLWGLVEEDLLDIDTSHTR